MRFSIFKSPVTNRSTYSLAVSYEDTLNNFAPEYVKERVLDKLADKLVEDLYPDIRKAVLKQKPKIIKEATKAFVTGVVERHLNKP